MADIVKIGSIDEYIAGFPGETQQRLEEVRALIRAAAPDAVETISYGIPTSDLRGKHLVHSGGYKNHLGFYPTPTGTEAFQEELKPYKRSKGTVQLPLDQPLPAELIGRIVAFRIEEVTRAAAKQGVAGRPPREGAAR
jgi:uncharacterized protein YdhG (YjbR/CyaY superfamily)